MDPRKHLKYSFSYKKLGFEPAEFKICLSSKVDKLLESFDLRGVETVKGKAINDVREQVCIQRSNQYLASRQREGRLFDFPHLTRYEDDIPEPNPVQRRQTRTKNKIRNKNYHEEQRRLFKDILRQEFQELFPFIVIDEKGFLSSSVSGREIKATEFCNVIDEISANFLNKNLKTRGAQGHDGLSTYWRTKLESVSESCQRILQNRMAVVGSIDNDLMDQGGYRMWSDHVKVIVSFAALMVVTKMIIAVDDRDRNIDPSLIFLIMIVFFVLCQLCLPNQSYHK